MYALVWIPLAARTNFNKTKILNKYFAWSTLHGQLTVSIFPERIKNNVLAFIPVFRPHSISILQNSKTIIRENS